MSSMGDSDDGGSGGGTSGPVFSGSSKPTIELQDVLFTIRDESNEARANIRKKQEDKEKLQREIDDMKTQNEQLAVKVRELNEQREAQRAAKKAAEMAQRSSVPTEDFCCQVNIENLQKKSQDSDSRRKSIVRRTPRPDLPKEPDSRTTSAATPEDKDRPTPTPSTPSSNSQRNSITPSSSSPNQKKDSLTRSAQGGTPKGSNAGTTRRSKQSLSAKQPAEEKEGEGEEKESKGGRKKRSLMEFAGPTEEPTEVSAAVGMSVKRKQNQKKDMLSTSTSPSPSPWDGESSSGSSEITLKCPSDGPLKIPDDQLEQLFRSHITNLLGVAQPLLDQLLDLRRNARLEIRKIKDRVNAIGALEKKIAKFLDVAPEDRETLPVIELNVDRTNMTVTHRSPQPHRCPLCYCRETTTSSLDVTVLNQKAMLEKSLEMSKAYQNVLKDMRDTYSHVCSTPMVEGQKIVKTLLSQLVWGELGTSDYSNLDEEFDDEMESAVEGAQEVPEGLQDLVKHAVYVTDIVRTLVRDLAKILRNDKIRMDCVKKQDKYLSQLETAMGNARTYMDDTAVHLTRVRAGTDFLKNVMVLAMSKCFCCKCYNSALDDGTRIVPDTSDISVSKSHRPRI
ncbi:uncharacterized protein LOC143289305 [Babylonia areolata]|uniref:uncharacterized protein LOC143289305 n=1 Tax=Babylonia areolata TaxID=304850 RepID=UPI003FD3C1BA